MRYLIHSEDATFDTETGKYTFSLDRRISDPRRIRINSAAYIAPTMATYPQVVYLRSSKLSEAVRRKHTVELKDNSHENATDTLCVLHETHTTGRYNMDTQSKRNFAVHSHLPLRKIDFYFTNNRTNLGATPSRSDRRGYFGNYGPHFLPRLGPRGLDRPEPDFAKRGHHVHHESFVA